MQTLTPEQFKQKYGVIAASQFDATKKQDDQEKGLFQSIKDDLSTRASNNVDIYNQGTANGDTSLLHNTAVGTQLAGNTFGGVGDVIGETLTHLPVVGGAFKALGGAIKGARDTAVNALSNTSLIKGAAQGDTSNLEEGLKIASGAGDISNNILAVDGGINSVKKTATRASDAFNSLKERGTPPIDPGGPSGTSPEGSSPLQYMKGAVRDIVPTKQNLIDENVAKGLDLTSGDLAKIEQKTGNPVGQWLSDQNVIGLNKATTQANIQSILDTNYKGVRAEIGKVKDEYNINQVPGYYTALNQLKGIVEGVPGLEKVTTTVTNLMEKGKITLNDIQAAKELMDKYDDLFNGRGDPKQAASKQGLVNVRKDLQTFIEDKVEQATGADIRGMNNNVTTAKAISDAIKARSTRGLTRTHFTTRDMMIGLGLTYFGTPLLGLAYVGVMKLIQSPTARLRFARYLDQLNDAEKAKVSEEFKDGNLSKEVQDIVGVNERTPSAQESGQ